MQSPIKYTIKTLKIFLIIFLAIIFIRLFVIEPSKINGRSMENTYLDEDLLLVNKFILLFRKPKRQEIVQVVSPYSKEMLVKRVIAFPGEQVTIKKGKIFVKAVDGEEIALKEPYRKTRFPLNQSKQFEVIPDHHYFVVGDNPEKSTDSRHYGAIHRNRINGLVIEAPNDEDDDK